MNYLCLREFRRLGLTKCHSAQTNAQGMHKTSQNGVQVMKLFSTQEGIPQRPEAPLWGASQTSTYRGRAVSVRCVKAGLISL